MHETDTLSDFAMRMDRARIPYMVTGSVAGQFYGLGRSTMDTDVVIDLPAGRGQFLLGALGDGWFVDQEMVVGALTRRAMFNVLARAGGKFDLIPLTDEPFEQAKFERRVAVDWHGNQVAIITAADLVLSKLAWARDSLSATQFGDVRAIMARGHFDEHDAYFQRWLGRLGLRETLDLARPA